MPSRQPWSACPSCAIDIGSRPTGSKAPFTRCPRCGVSITPIWWQRYLFASFGLVVSVAVPAALGIRGILALVLAALVCIYPALILAYVLVFKVMPPKYELKPGEVVTLFHR